MPKRGDSCKRKAARAGLDCLYKKRNKFIFWQIVIPLSLHACSDAFSFFSRLTSAPPGMPSTSPYTPLTTRSSFILTVCTEIHPSSCLITGMEQIRRTANKHASARISYGFPSSVSLSFPSSLVSHANMQLAMFYTFRFPGL